MTAARRRLFFALWPDDDTRSALARLARSRLGSASGRLVPGENLHLTLVFIGSVDGDFRACAECAAEGLAVPSFAMEFVRIGYWPRPRVLWSAPHGTPDALAGLASTLSSALVQCGHEPASRPFHAHITLARKLRGPVSEAVHTPVRWPVSEFHLVESETLPEGARYRRLRSWSLQ